MNDSAENNDLPVLSDEVLAEEMALLRRETPYRNVFDLLGDLPDTHQRNIYKIAEALDVVVREVSDLGQADRVKVIRRLSTYLYQFS